MPSLPKHPCVRCGVLLEAGAACAQCQPVRERWRGTTAARGYAHGWPKVRAAKLASEPFCQIRTHCHGAIATEVDHIIPISERPDLRLEWNNLQSTCRPCNVAKSSQRIADCGA